jgi:hypothetical protein
LNPPKRNQEAMLMMFGDEKNLKAVKELVTSKRPTNDPILRSQLPNK